MHLECVKKEGARKGEREEASGLQHRPRESSSSGSKACRFQELHEMKPFRGGDGKGDGLQGEEGGGRR